MVGFDEKLQGVLKHPPIHPQILSHGFPPAFKYLSLSQLPPFTSISAPLLYFLIHLSASRGYGRPGCEDRAVAAQAFHEIPPIHPSTE